MSLVNMWFLEDLHVLYIVVVNGSVLFTKERKKLSKAYHKRLLTLKKYYGDGMCLHEFFHHSTIISRITFHI